MEDIRPKSHSCGTSLYTTGSSSSGTVSYQAFNTECREKSV